MEQFAVIDNYLCIKMPQEVDHHWSSRNQGECRQASVE